MDVISLALLKKLQAGGGSGQPSQSDFKFYEVTCTNGEFYYGTTKLNYAQLVDKFNDDKYFLYLKKDNLIYIPSIETNDALAFSVAWTRREEVGDAEYAQPYISRVIINADEVVRSEQTGLQSNELLLDNFEDYEDQYGDKMVPTAKAVKNLVGEGGGSGLPSTEDANDGDVLTVQKLGFPIQGNTADLDYKLSFKPNVSAEQVFNVLTNLSADISRPLIVVSATEDLTEDLFLLDATDNYGIGIDISGNGKLLCGVSKHNDEYSFFDSQRNTIDTLPDLELPHDKTLIITGFISQMIMGETTQQTQSVYNILSTIFNIGNGDVLYWSPVTTDTTSLIIDLPNDGAFQTVEQSDYDNWNQFAELFGMSTFDDSKPFLHFISEHLSGLIEDFYLQSTQKFVTNIKVIKNNISDNINQITLKTANNGYCFMLDKIRQVQLINGMPITYYTDHSNIMLMYAVGYCFILFSDLFNSDWCYDIADLSSLDAINAYGLVQTLYSKGLLDIPTSIVYNGIPYTFKKYGFDSIPGENGQSDTYFDKFHYVTDAAYFGYTDYLTANEIIIKINEDDPSDNNIEEKYAYETKDQVDIGSYQFSGLDEKVFPKITSRDANMIYASFANGYPVMIKWNVLGIPLNFQVLSCDKIGNKASFDILVHNMYLCDYSFEYQNPAEDPVEEYATCNIIKLGSAS